MKFHSTALLTISLLLSACGGGGSNSPASSTTAGGNTGAGSDTVIQQSCVNKFGQNWTTIDVVQQKLPYLSDIVYGNGLFLATADNKVASSKDGEHWVTIPAYNFDQYNADSYVLAYAFGKFVSVANDHSGRMSASSSVDGVAWDKVKIADNASTSSLTLPEFFPQDITYGNGRLIVVGSDTRIIWSMDGKNWQLAANLANLNIPKNYYFNWSAFANGKFYTATGADSHQLYVSTDGNTWQAQKINGDGAFPSSQITGMQFINGIYVAVDGNGVIANSSDTINWKTVVRGTRSPSIFKNQIAAGSGQVMIIDYQGDTSEIAYSCDGVTWAKAKTSTGSFINTIAIGDTVAVKVGGHPAFSRN